MKRLFKLIRNISFFIIFSLILTTISITLVSYSLKGKQQYLNQKIDKNQINISSIEEHIDKYSLETRNNTTYLTIYTSLDKDNCIALLTRLYMQYDINTYPLQVTIHYNEDILWASINEKGISIS